MKSNSQTRTIPVKYVQECGVAQLLSSTVRSQHVQRVQGTYTYIYHIVTFDERSSQGQVAMVIYEWKDVKFLGVTTPTSDDSLPVSKPLRTRLPSQQ